jgi:hypothetical protein
MSVTERLLITVTDVFVISGRATCPLPVVPFELIEPSDGVRLRPGDHLELRRPDGFILKTTLLGLEWFRPSKGGLVISLEPKITKEKVPVGTEIWRVDFSLAGRG